MANDVLKHILHIDDHPLISVGLERILSEDLPQYELVIAHCAKHAIEKAKMHPYAMIIFDLQIPDTDTQALFSHLLEVQYGVPVLIYSNLDELVYGRRYMLMGAKGFLSKSAPAADVLHAIRQILQGKNYVSDTLLDILIHGASHAGSSNPFDRLSKREFEVMQHLIQGYSLKEICLKLSLQPSTIGTQKAKIFEKVGVRNVNALQELARIFKVTS